MYGFLITLTFQEVGLLGFFNLKFKSNFNYKNKRKY